MLRWTLPLCVLMMMGCPGPQGEQGLPGEDGRDGADGTNGTDGKDGTDGTNGNDGNDGADSPCAGRDPVNLTGLFGGQDVVYTNYPVTVDVLREGTIPLTYSVAGFGVDYLFDGDQFEAVATQVNASTQIIVATDGCTIDTYAWDPNVQPGVFNIDVIHLADAEGRVEFGPTGSDPVGSTDYEGITSVQLDWGDYAFDITAEDGSVLETTTVATYEPADHLVVVVYGDEGVTSITTLDPDLSNTTDPATQFRLTTVHAADGTDSVDVYDKLSSTKLFDDLALGDDDTETDLDVGKYGFAVDTDEDGTTDLDIARFDATDLNNEHIVAGIYEKGDEGYKLFTLALKANEFDVADLWVTYGSSPDALVESDAGPVTDTITVTDCTDLLDWQIEVEITHEYRSDVVIDIEDPAGDLLPLWERPFDRSDDVFGIFDATDGLDYTPGGDDAYFTVADMADYQGTNADGDWTLTVEDDVFGDDGRWRSWSMIMQCGI